MSDIGCDELQLDRNDNRYELPNTASSIMNQEIRFVHEPSQIRSAAIGWVSKRLKEPKVYLVLVVLFVLLLVGLFSSHTWLIVLPGAVYVAMLLMFIQYVVTSPRVFCGVEIQMSVQEDGIYFSGSNRSGMVGWAGFKEIYPLKKMWAVFVKNSDAVTYIPTEQLNQETLEHMLAKLRENNVRIHGEGPQARQSPI